MLLSCDQCGVFFQRKPSRATPPNYCSRACSASHQQQDLADRFWAMVDKNGPIIRPELGPCWPWTHSTTSHGYGCIRIAHRTCLAHRVAYLLTYGDPGDLDVLHSCDNPPCVRPPHLFLGTHLDNMVDMSTKGRAGSTLHPESRPRGDEHWRARMPERGARGERVGTAKLNAELVIEIRHRYAGGGVSQLSLATEFGVDQQTIWSVVHGHTWSHIAEGEIA